MMQRQQGMTVWEIMTGAALVIIVGALFFLVFWKISAKSRDLQREQDIKQMQNALNLYITNIGHFPICDNEITVNGVDDCLTVELKRVDAIVGVPADPLSKKGGQCGDLNSHIYCYESLDGLSYVLKYNLETNDAAGLPTGQAGASGWRSIGP